MNKLSFNKSQLQYIAIIAMVIDHVSYFVPLPAYYLCRFIGRITIVIMSYFIAEGYYRTHDLNKYIMRMGIFAAASQVPFYLYEHGAQLPHDLYHLLTGLYFGRNVMFTLFLGLCLLTILRSEYKIVWKLLAVFAAWKLAKHSDWDWFCLMWVCAFGLLHGNTKGQMCAAGAIVFLRVIKCMIPVISLFVKNLSPDVDVLALLMAVLEYRQFTFIFAVAQFGGLLAIPLLKRYNGERGNAPRMLFYVFYPAHLLLLFIAKLLIA